MSKEFQCRIVDRDGDEWVTVTSAHYDEMAARLYAEESDANSAMELLDDNAEVVVEVKNENGVIKRFKCSREMVPSYSANEVDPKPEPVSDIPY